MVKMLFYAALASVMLTLVAPRMAATMQTMQAENAALAQLTADTTPMALQSPQAGDRLTALAQRLLALASGEAPTRKVTALQASRWVPVGQYADALAMAQAQARQVAP